MAERPRNELRETDPTHWFSLQKRTTAQTDPEPGPGTRNTTASPMWVTGIQLFWLSPLPPRVCINRKLESGTKARRWTRVLWCRKRCLNCQYKCLLEVVHCRGIWSELYTGMLSLQKTRQVLTSVVQLLLVGSDLNSMLPCLVVILALLPIQFLSSGSSCTS